MEDTFFPFLCGGPGGYGNLYDHSGDESGPQYRCCMGMAFEVGHRIAKLRKMENTYL
jgi:hypothetical protein